MIPWLAGVALAWETFSAPIMHTRIDATLPDGAAADAASVFAAFREVEASANEWREDSPIGRLNRAAGGEAIPLPPDVEALLRRAVHVAARTDGAFDPTWAALWGLWDWDVPRVPDAAELRARAARVDWRRLEIGEGTARLPEGAVVGLGAIAKGWALDRAATDLRARGREDFLLSAGGQVYAAGTRDGRSWRVGVRDPRGEPDDTFATLAVSDTSVSTSGDYERFFVVDGARYHHILDPRTGWPARGARAVTVVTPDATLADALSTALMVLGPDDGLACVARFPGVEALVVDTGGRVHVTRGMPVAEMRRPRP